MSDNGKSHPIHAVNASSPPRQSSLANPGTLCASLILLYYTLIILTSFPSGLFSFASTTLILSLYNAGARNIVEPNLVVGMAIFCGGLAQLLAGMWEFPRGNTFAATGTSFVPFTSSPPTTTTNRLFLFTCHFTGLIDFIISIAFYGISLPHPIVTRGLPLLVSRTSN
jgi:hypothetical protein